MKTMMIKYDGAVKRLIRKKINSDLSENFLSDSLYYAVLPENKEIAGQARNDAGILVRHAELVSASRENKRAIKNKYVFIPIL